MILHNCSPLKKNKITAKSKQFISLQIKLNINNSYKFRVAHICFTSTINKMSLQNMLLWQQNKLNKNESNHGFPSNLPSIAIGDLLYQKHK